MICNIRPHKDPLKLKEILERAYSTFNRREFLKTDPVCLVHQYRRKEDVETAGFIVSIFSLGRVENIIKKASEVLNLLGESPYSFLASSSPLPRINVNHRFFSGEDVRSILRAMRKTIKNFRTVENAFGNFYLPGSNLKEATREFMLYMRKLTGREDAHGIKMAFPLPDTGPCKRWLMFLRWMVRKDDVDFGIWTIMKPSELIIPLDTHVFSIARELSLTSRKTPSWSAAVEITEKLKEFDGEDPVRYDFAIMRIGYMRTRGIKWAEEVIKSR